MTQVNLLQQHNEGLTLENYLVHCHINKSFMNTLVYTVKAFHKIQH